MKLPENLELFDFVRVTSNEVRAANRGFFDNEANRSIEPLNRLWLNVRGSPRNRKGEMWAKRFGPWSLIIWVHKGKTSDNLEYWYGEMVVLEGGDVLSYTSAVGAKDAVRQDMEWEAWLALLDYLEYITKAIDSQLS